MADCEIHPKSSFPHEWREDFEIIKSQIPSYKMKITGDDQLWECIGDLKDLNTLISMGWTSEEKFTTITGMKPKEMVGKYFSIINNRVYFE